MKNDKELFVKFIADAYYFLEEAGNSLIMLEEFATDPDTEFEKEVALGYTLKALNIVLNMENKFNTK